MLTWGLVNALIIGVDLLVISYGIWLAKVKRDFRRHPPVMMLAAALFLVFLASFLVKIVTVGPQASPVWPDNFFHIQPKHILYAHEALALVTVPVVATTYWFAYKRQFAKHRRLARYAWPLWIFESLFGIAEYVILYHT